MKKYLYTNGQDIVCAESVDGAEMAWRMQTGASPDAPFKKIQDSMPIKLSFGAWGLGPDISNTQIPPSAYVKQIDGSEYHVTAVAADWAAANGVGIISSTYAPKQDDVTNLGDLL